MVQVEERGGLRMLSSKDRALKQPSQRANHFSFPPTQRTGLLVSPTIQRTRSSSQRLNLQRSYRALLDALSLSVPEAAAAH